MATHEPVGTDRVLRRAWRGITGCPNYEFRFTITAIEVTNVTHLLAQIGEMLFIRRIDDARGADVHAGTQRGRGSEQCRHGAWLA
jgi:hypothetical protein